MNLKLPLDVSILISARNEEKNIASLLVSLANQTARENIKEILVADNRSVDRTREVIEQISDTYDLNVKTYPLAVNNLGNSRRFLVAKANSEYLVFVDADCKVDSQWLQTLIGHYSNLSKHNPKLAGVGGPNRLPGKNIFQKTINQNLNSGWLHGFSSQAQKASTPLGKKKDHLPTTNALIKKSAILDVGNFSPLFERVGEDLDLGLRMRKKYDLIMMPGPEVINDCAEDLTAWLKRMHRFGQAQAFTVGRRLAGPTWLILITTGIAISVPFLSTEQLITISVLALTVLSLVSRPIAFKRIRTSNIWQGVASYFLAIVTLMATILFYTLGFYSGLIKRLFGTRGQNARPLPSHG